MERSSRHWNLYVHSVLSIRRLSSTTPTLHTSIPQPSRNPEHDQTWSALQAARDFATIRAEMCIACIGTSNAINMVTHASWRKSMTSGGIITDLAVSGSSDSAVPQSLELASTHVASLIGSDEPFFSPIRNPFTAASLDKPVFSPVRV